MWDRTSAVFARWLMQSCESWFYHTLVNCEWDVAIYLIKNSNCCELNLESMNEISAISSIFSWASSVISTSLLNLVSNSDVYISRSSNVLTAIVSANIPLQLRMLLHRLSQSLISVLLAHQAEMIEFSLYRVATRPFEKVIDMILDAGVDLELKDDEHDILLMGACVTSRLEVVKTLISKDVKISYVRDEKARSVIIAARLHPQITRWLLVDRFMKALRCIMREKCQRDDSILNEMTIWRVGYENCIIIHHHICSIITTCIIHLV